MKYGGRCCSRTSSFFFFSFFSFHQSQHQQYHIPTLFFFVFLFFFIFVPLPSPASGSSSPDTLLYKQTKKTAYPGPPTRHHSLCGLFAWLLFAPLHIYGLDDTPDTDRRGKSEREREVCVQAERAKKKKTRVFFAPPSSSFVALLRNR